ncbi:MAG TPA: transglycosylase SLT domain-containing protein [Pyrinomonadaceae bacterium]|jgi:soluble lytic murein transglycosylase|nr:transglycosylase SLT domain-containing protein [Pyrinomonadaceae bacterium]
MKDLTTRPRGQRITFVSALCAALALASALPLTVASCRTQTARADEPAAFERLRLLTRGGTLPAEPVVAQLASEYAGTRTGALAGLLRARIRYEARDYAAAATLLRSEDAAKLTKVGDYALWLRADALEKSGNRAEARAALEQLARVYPDSLRARDAIVHAAVLLAQEGQAAGVPAELKGVAATDDAEALLLTAKSYEQSGEQTNALAAYRRLYFYAPGPNDAEAVAAFARLGSTQAPASAEEAVTRAEKLYRAKRYADAVAAFADAFARFPETATPQARLRRGFAAFNARRSAETVEALNSVPASAGETRAEALNYLAQNYARARQWDAARSTLEEMRRVFPKSVWTMRALAAAGQTAKDAKDNADALYFDRLAVQLFPGEPEVAGAQFDTAWAAHDAKNFNESARLLIEHLSLYADRNTDNRGKAGYWAARDSERAGHLAEAQALYEAMLMRYGANWYGYLSQQRLDQLKQVTNKWVPGAVIVEGSPLARAVENLKPVAVAEETAGPAEAARLEKAEQLSAVAWDVAAHAELDRALESAPNSPRLNLAKARLYRASEDNLQALNVLKRSFPDYSQMQPEELTRDEWDVFYPLAYWDTIAQEARAKNLDPYTVAGLIRQETVFNPRAVSPANAYGLMQLLPATARLTAKRYGVDDPVTTDSLFDPRLNIRLGTSYLREQLDKYGRIEYVAAAYNAGPGRLVQWRASLPLQIDEWDEAIPFKETRGYVQGVVRNTLQYRRLYDEQGRFRPEVGTRAPRRDISTATPAPSPDANTRPRRVSNEEEE